MINSVVGEKLL